MRAALNTRTEQTGAAAPARRQPIISRHVIEGQALRVAVWPGREGGTPLLVFNGIGSRLELLTPFVDCLDPAREVIIFDIPGAGDSPAPRWPYRLWMLARMTGRLLDRLGHDRVDLMGISWGGALAQQFAVQMACRCRRVILAATTPGALMIPGDPRVLLKMATPRRFNDPSYLKENFGALYGGLARTSPELFEEFNALSRAPGRRGYLFQQLALTGWNSLPFLPLIRAPTLILAGDDDPIVPVINARMMARLIPDCKLTVLEDGHLFLFSQAARCAADIEAFLEAGD